MRQDNRSLKVQTSLGDERLVLRRVTGRERISGLFEYELELISREADIDPATMLASNISFHITGLDGYETPYNGFVHRFWYDGTTDEWTTYRATVVPWLWFLTQTTDCRIFQHQTVLDIVQTVLRDFSFSDVDYSFVTEGDYVEREYCVQYGESDFDFLSRLLEEEGIFYYFRHRNGQHTLVLGDKVDAYAELHHGTVSFPMPAHSQDYANRITDWQHQYQFLTGKVANTDYNFKTPTNDLLSDVEAQIEAATAKDFEQFEYPGHYLANSQGRRVVRIRAEELESNQETILAESDYESLQAGGVIEVDQHRLNQEMGRRYLIVENEFEASVAGAYVSGTHEEEERFANRFHAIPAERLFRPERTTPKAIVEGPQTAVVVGEAMANGKKEEITTDEDGCVKVQFHWDRRGAYNEQSSCWIRVSQVHAGRRFGGIDLPRIGEEVIVDFLEGDPDRPIITGRVYNGLNRPPFSLPANKTRSGVKTNSYQGAGSSQISMDDTSGAEQLQTTAQFDMDTQVGNNQTLVVNVDRSEEVVANDSLKVGVNRSEDIGVDKTVNVGSNMNVNVGSKMVVNAGSSITLKCGASKIHMNAGGVITITGTIITTAAAANAAVAAPMTQVIGGAMLTTVGGINMMNGGVCSVNAAGLASVSGGKVDVVASGETSIKGGTITLN